MFTFAAVILSSIIYLMSPSSVKDLSVVERASRLGVQEICINDMFLADSTGAVTDFYRLRGASNSDFVRFSKAERDKAPHAVQSPLHIHLAPLVPTVDAGGQRTGVQ